MYFAGIEVIPLKIIRFWLKFKNREENFFDMRPYLEMEIFKELKNEFIFNTAKVSFDTVEWCNEADIDSETLYHESIHFENSNTI